MIGITLEIEDGSQQVLDLLLDRALDRMQRVADETFKAIERPMLDELRKQPGKVKYPIQWTSERQRRAFFATNGFGAGIPYQRTGGLSRSWAVEGAPSDTGYRVTVSTPSDAAKFVVGSLKDVVIGRQNFQQRFHQNTGWFIAADVVGGWFDVYLEELARRLKEMEA